MNPTAFRPSASASTRPPVVFPYFGMAQPANDYVLQLHQIEPNRETVIQEAKDEATRKRLADLRDYLNKLHVLPAERKLLKEAGVRVPEEKGVKLYILEVLAGILLEKVNPESTYALKAQADYEKKKARLQKFRLWPLASRVIKPPSFSKPTATIEEVTEALAGKGELADKISGIVKSLLENDLHRYCQQDGESYYLSDDGLNALGLKGEGKTLEFPQ